MKNNLIILERDPKSKTNIKRQFSEQMYRKLKMLVFDRLASEYFQEKFIRKKRLKM